MPSVTRPRRGDDTSGLPPAQQHVLEVVEGLLAEGHTFTELSIGRIADAAGMGRSTFYGHFPDKPALLVRLAGVVVGDALGLARDWVAAPAHTRAGLVDTLTELVAEHRRHVHLIRAVTEVAGYEPTVEAFWRAQIDGFAAVARERLERDGTASGLEAETAATMLAWGTERAIALHVERRPEADDPAFATALAGRIWAALGRD
jgi:AcrR family transcriptional regulator